MPGGRRQHLPGPLIPVAGADHFTITHELRDADGELTRQLLLLARPPAVIDSRAAPPAYRRQARGMMANKVYKDAKSALEGVLFDGMMLMCGGFGLVGIPEKLIAAVRDSGVKDLTCVSNNAGIDGFGPRPAAGDRPDQEDDLVLCRREQDLRQALPRGQARDRVQPAGHAWPSACRAGGAGIPAFYTKTGVGTAGRRGQGDPRSSTASNTSWSAAWSPTWRWSRRGRATPRATSSIRKTARNFNPMMATAGKVTVAEVEELVEVGELDPDHIHTPGIFVNRIFCGAPLREADRADAPSARLEEKQPMAWTRDQMAARAARSCRTASTSTSASASRPWWPTTSRQDVDVTLQSENGMLGIGPFPLRRRGRPRPHQCRQADRHRAAGHVLFLARPTASP